jgi:integrase
MATYLAPELLAMPLPSITPLHLTREWNRLLISGGHTRKTKTPRPLKAKSVRSIAGVVSSAFACGIRWGVTSTNPVTNSARPKGKKHLGVALTPAQKALVLSAATSPWCLPIFLEVAGATACRRGELLALRWSDIQDGRAMIARSLSQTDDGLQFKDTKTDNPHPVAIPEDALAALAAHRLRQDEFRKQFGPDYHSDLNLIFANPDGTPFNPDSISATVGHLFRKLKMPKGASLHSLRHTHVSELVDEGVPLSVISARLGHSSIRTTADIYAHMIHGQDDEAARRWSERKKRQAAQEKERGAGCATQIQ